MRFESPLALLLLVFLPLILSPEVLRRLFLRKSTHRSTTGSFSHAVPFSLAALPISYRSKIRGPILGILLGLSYFLFVIALARPQFGSSFSEVEDSGRDIMLTLDLSGSMSAVDFSIDGKRVNRLTALKHVVKQFIDERKGDRMGLVVFGDQVFTQCPLTTDHEALKSFVDAMEVAMAGERTAIGDALAISAKRVRDIPGESKVIVLVTDGSSNSGAMPPIEAARLAKKLGIKIHAVGIGSDGYAPMPAVDLFGRQVLQNVQVEYDEETLKTIASATNGHYFNAKDTAGLKEVYAEINKLEERKENSYQFIAWEEKYFPFLLLGIILFAISEILQATVFLRIPE